MNKPIVENDVLKKVREDAIQKADMESSFGNKYVISKTPSSIVISSSKKRTQSSVDLKKKKKGR